MQARWASPSSCGSALFGVTVPKSGGVNLYVRDIFGDWLGENTSDCLKTSFPT